MSNRKSAFQSDTPNPAQYFLSWSNTLKCFKYFDKEKKESVPVPLPLKFLSLEIMHTVKGFHKDHESGIYANEVKHIGEEPVSVKCFDHGEIASGLWKDIKPLVENVGGKYHQSLYIMTESGRLLNISLKGAGVSSWFEFTKKTKARLSDEWVIVEEYGEGKTGSVEYTYPKFRFDGNISVEQEKTADACFDELEEYLKKYKSTSEEEKEPRSESAQDNTPDEMDILVNGEKEVNTNEVWDGETSDPLDEPPF